jgi:GT2 family glycosyltransferase
MNNPKTSQIGLSIVLYKTDPLILESCANCILRSTVNADVTIIDNSPDDRIKAKVIDIGFDYINLKNNPGYGFGHNVAIRRSIDKGLDYHLVLNADVIFQDDIIEKIKNFMDINAKTALTMPKILNPDGTIQRLCKLVPTPADLFVRRFLPDFFAKGMRNKFELWSSGYNKTMFVPYLSGCFMFLRCSALKEVGIFDERFFMYPEDIDLTRRLAEKFDTVFYPYVSVTHEHGAASYKSFRMLFIHMYNLFKYFNKWGWFIDEGRSRLNQRTLRELKNKEIQQETTGKA